jgi:Fe(3+) dicitrate transport protein
MKKLKATSLIALLPIVSMAKEISAEGVSAPETPFVQLEPFTVIGSEEAAFNMPGSGIYLGSEQLERFKFANINEILRQAPGVNVRDEDGYGLFPNISIRGVDTNRSGKVTLMEDGILTAPAPYSAPAAYYSPTAGRMSGIEILKGSSQVQYGPHTTGGVINYISTYLRMSSSCHKQKEE